MAFTAFCDLLLRGSFSGLLFFDGLLVVFFLFLCPFSPLVRLLYIIRPPPPPPPNPPASEPLPPPQPLPSPKSPKSLNISRPPLLLLLLLMVLLLLLDMVKGTSPTTASQASLIKAILLHHDQSQPMNDGDLLAMSFEFLHGFGILGESFARKCINSHSL
eukprot:1165464_1